MKGKYVELKDSIKGFQKIVDGKHDDLPEQAEADLKQSHEDLAKVELPEEVDAALDLAKTAETRIALLSGR